METPIIIPFAAHHVWAFPPQSGMTAAEMFLMAQKMEAAGPAFTGILGGVPVCAAGMGLYWNGLGEAWTLFTPAILATHKIWLTRTTKRILHEVIRDLNLHRVQIAVRVSDEANHCWAKLLGFSDPYPLKKYGPDGSEFIGYSILKKGAN